MEEEDEDEDGEGRVMDEASTREGNFLWITTGVLGVNNTTIPPCTSTVRTVPPSYEVPTS